jgi:glycosyltransferase involved in cell wall biosynthesis
MKISVIIPVFNEEKYIATCLNCLTKQTEKPDEIIIVDNNCTDQTINIVRKFNHQLPLKIIREKTRGTTFARNKGFEKASGDILVRTDADTKQPKNWLEIIKKNFLNSKDIDALTGPVVFYDLPLKSTFYSKLLIYGFKVLTGSYPVFGPGMALRKKAWIKVENKLCLDDKQVHEDFDLAIHLHKNNLKIAYDKNFISYTSGRRIKQNPRSFFCEYSLRLARMIFTHR